MKGSKRYAKATVCCMAVLASGLVLSCSDDWDAHYDGVPRPTRTLWQEITARPELSDFAKLLKGYGYDKFLDSGQRYTVWAPSGSIDTTLVTGEDMTPDEVMEQVVKNHIARGVIAASSVVNDTIKVLNGKPMPFVSEGGVPHFNGSPAKSFNIECSNGDLHILDCQAVYNNNVWSYLRQDADFSNITDYLYSFNKLEFVPELSTPGGVVNGEQVYTDSVFVLTNELWGRLAT